MDFLEKDIDRAIDCVRNPDASLGYRVGKREKDDYELGARRFLDWLMRNGYSIVRNP
jgi:hypothetical protein